MLHLDKLLIVRMSFSSSHTHKSQCDTMIYSLNEFQITTPLGRYISFLFYSWPGVAVIFVLISLLWECIKFVIGFRLTTAISGAVILIGAPQSEHFPGETKKK